MNVPRIAIAMNYIDDELVNESITFKVPGIRPHRKAFFFAGICAACLCLIIGIAVPRTNNNDDNPDISSDTSSDIASGIAPAHFYYKGACYVYNGLLTYSLPEGFELIREVNNVGNTFSGIDFDGNVDGYIYMDPSDESVAYFKWKEWDEETDGREPYLILYPRE